jgi:hypothetical protein
MSRKYPTEFQKADGWTCWIHPLAGFRMSCCDCGLVHELEFSRADDDSNKILFRARRDNRATAGRRRGKKFKKKIG